MNTIIDSQQTPKSVSKKKRSKSLGIRSRLLIGFVVITAVFLAAICTTLVIVTHTKKFTNNVINVVLPSHDALLDLSMFVYMTETNTQSWLLTNDVKFKAHLKKNWESIAKIESQADILSTGWIHQDEKTAWIEIKSQLTQLKINQEQAINTVDKSTAMQIYLSKILPIVNQVSESLNSVTTGNQRSTSLLDVKSYELSNDAENIVSALTTLQITEYILVIVGVLTALIIYALTTRSIMLYINNFRRHSSRIARGDLTKFIEIDSNDELGQLGDDLNTMTESLASITRKITQTCHSMVTTLEEVRHAVDTQSSGASEQAASINEITASVSEIEKSTEQTLEKATTLGAAAEKTREKGQMGVEAVEQSVIGMKAVREKVQLIAQTILDLSNKTQQVGEITSVVNNLAQQSKMLALNASIEAVKAGEAGKGFAVVAVEVKNLAEQSEHSTTQVQKILEDIRRAAEKAVMVTEEGTKGVDHGTTLVEQAGDIIRSLNDVIHETSVASQQIEAAVRQESAGIEQVTTGMNEINQVTATFVASVKQTTEAMDNLADITKNLKSYIETYKI